MVNTATVRAPFLKLFPNGEILNATLSNPAAPNVITWISPSPRSARMVAQQGWFSVGLNILTDHDETILRLCTEAATIDREVHFAKWGFPESVKWEILRQLRFMNVAPQAPFPGIDGLGRSIHDLIELQAQRSPQMRVTTIPAASKIVKDL